MDNTGTQALPTRNNDLLSAKIEYPALGKVSDRANRELLEQLQRMEQLGILTQAAMKQVTKNHLVSQEQAISLFNTVGRLIEEASHLTQSQKQFLLADLERVGQVLSIYNTVAAEALFAELLKGANSREQSYLERLDDAAGAFLKHITFGLYKPYQRRW
jgi:hypothetical protein